MASRWFPRNHTNNWYRRAHPTHLPSRAFPLSFYHSLATKVLFVENTAYNPLMPFSTLTAALAPSARYGCPQPGLTFPFSLACLKRADCETCRVLPRFCFFFTTHHLLSISHPLGLLVNSYSPGSVEVLSSLPAVPLWESVAHSSSPLMSS